MDKHFINEFLSIGMYDYFYGTANSFESHIVECLSDIYSADKIKSLYDSNDEIGFQNMIYEYGLKNTVYEDFLRNTIKYENFKKNNKDNPTYKSDIASIVETSIINMYITKSIVKTPSVEDLSHFENDLLNNFEIVKMHFNTSKDPNHTRKVWEAKKKILNDNVQLVKIKPEYLDEFTYARFGINIDEVKNMDYRMVQELNRYVTEKLANMYEAENNQTFKRKTVLSSGNGFVDALFIASIIATEISIGLIYIFLHM